MQDNKLYAISNGEGGYLHIEYEEGFSAYSLTMKKLTLNNEASILKETLSHTFDWLDDVCSFILHDKSKRPFSYVSLDVYDSFLDLKVVEIKVKFEEMEVVE